MTVDFPYDIRDIFPFYPDDVPSYPDKNSRSSSFLVGENDVASASSRPAQSCRP